MHPDEFEDLKCRIAATMDPTTLLDFLGFTMFDLVSVLREQIEEQHEEFKRELG